MTGSRCWGVAKAGPLLDELRTVGVDEDGLPTIVRNVVIRARSNGEGPVFDAGRRRTITNLYAGLGAADELRVSTKNAVRLTSLDRGVRPPPVRCDITATRDRPLEWSSVRSTPTTQAASQTVRRRP